MKIKSYKDLNIWKRSIVLVEDIYKITKNFPKEEIYGLISQLRKSAVSIPSNIAEGFARFYNKEYRQFLLFLWEVVPNFLLKLLLPYDWDFLKRKRLVNY